MAKSIVGLEITEEGVRAAEVTAGKNPVLLGYGSAPLPPEVAKDSEIFDRDAVVLAIRQLWARAQFKSKSVVLGIGNRRILVREYTTQAMKPELLKQALPYQVQDLLPVPADQAVLDFYPVSVEDEQVTGLLVAAVAETVEELVNTVGKARITVQSVDLVPFGLARAVTRLARQGETVAALHLGDHTSYVVVVQDGVPRFVRIIPVDILTSAVRAREGGEASMSDAVVVEEVLETVPPTAEPHSLRRRSAARGTVAVRPTGMSTDAIDDLVTRLASTLRFYADRSTDQPITRVVLSGAGAAVEGIAGALAASIPLPVEVVGAAQIVGTKSAFVTEDEHLDLVTTVGLALGDWH